MKRKTTERDIHRAVADHLARRAVPGVVYWHTPNAPRNAISGAILKRMGMRAGVSDFLLFHDSNLFAIELKAPGGRPTVEQLTFLAEINSQGGYGVVAEGLDEALGCLKQWGLLC